MYFGLEHHPLDPNPLNHNGRGEKLSERGWVSHNFCGCSGAEYRVAKEMAEERPDDIYVSFSRWQNQTNVCVADRWMTVEMKDTTMNVYASSQSILDEAIAAILALPPRTVELLITTPEDAKMASLLSRGSNHRLVTINDEEYRGPKWILSIEENVAAVQIKLSLP